MQLPDAAHLSQATLYRYMKTGAREPTWYAPPDQAAVSLAWSRLVCLGVAMSVGGPTSEARSPRAEVLASALLAACNGDYSVAVRLLRRTLDVLRKAQGSRL